MIAGVGVKAFGQMQAGKAAYAEAQSERQMAAYNAAIQEREARAIEQKTIFEQQRQAEAAARTQSTLRARLAASGALMGVGTPLLIQEEQAAESELEMALIGYTGMVEAERARSQAEIDRLSGEYAMQRGRAGRTAGYIGAGTTLLTGFSKVLEK